jgi:hypothetical protein
VERKTLRYSLKQEPDALLAGVVEGYAAVFGNVDDGKVDRALSGGRPDDGRGVEAVSVASWLEGRRPALPKERDDDRSPTDSRGEATSSRLRSQECREEEPARAHRRR